MGKFCVFMLVYHLTLRPLIKSEPLTEDRRFHMKDHSVIWCGQIQKILLRLGMWAQEVPVGCLVTVLLQISIIWTIWSWFVGLISWCRRDTSITLERRAWWLFGVHQTIVIDVVIWQASWHFQKIWIGSLSYSRMFQWIMHQFLPTSPCISSKLINW